MNYEVHIWRTAEKELDKLPAAVQTRITSKILSLESDPRPRLAKKLSGRDEYRLRIGDYRMLYTVDDTLGSVTVVAIGHRREVYR